MDRRRAHYPTGAVLHEYEVVRGRVEREVLFVDRTQDWRTALRPLLTVDVDRVPSTAARIERVPGVVPRSYVWFDAEGRRLDREGRPIDAGPRPELLALRAGPTGETAAEALDRYAAFVALLPPALAARRGLFAHGPPATSAEVAAAEVRLGLRVPASLAAFVTTRGGFGFGVDRDRRSLLPAEWTTAHAWLAASGLVDDVAQGDPDAEARLRRALIVSRIVEPEESTFTCLHLDQLDPATGAPAVGAWHEDQLPALARGPAGPLRYGFDAHVRGAVDAWIASYLAELGLPVS